MNAKKIISVVAGGTLEVEISEEIKRSDLIIAADFAAYWLMSHNIIADIAVGDFDSVTKHELEQIKKKIPIVFPFSPQKDETDFELAIKVAVKKRPAKLKIFGISGTRFDHTLASLGVLERVAKRGIHIEIIDGGHHMYIVYEREIVLKKSSQYRYISVIPLSSTAAISISGCKYPAYKKLFYRTKSLGVSNEMKEKLAKIVVHKGMVMVIESKDR